MSMRWREPNHTSNSFKPNVAKKPSATSTLTVISAGTGNSTIAISNTAAIAHKVNFCPRVTTWRAEYVGACEASRFKALSVSCSSA